MTILAVGDDDQNIYAFNGTSNEYIHRFQKDYDVAQPDYLTYNYRSTQHIISAANSVINGMEGRLKTLHPIVINPERRTRPNGGAWAAKDPERQGRVRLIRLPSGSSGNIQAQAVIAEIGRLKKQGGAAWDEIAVLSRRNEDLKPMQAWCEQNGVPYFLSADKSSKIKLRHTREFIRLIDGVQKAQGGLNSEAFAKLIDVQAEKSGGNWRQWFAQLKADFLHEYPPQENTLPENQDGAIRHTASFLKNWLYEYAGDENEIRSDGLFLGTAHAAKGLEFKHVFILDGGWSGTDEAERRLYYVAMTRAIETLTLLQTAAGYPWAGKLPADTDRVAQSFTELPELNTEYKTLSAPGGELDIGFIARDRSIPPRYDNIRPRLEAAARLKVGDSLEIRSEKDGRYTFYADGCPVARSTSKLKPIPPGTTAVAAAFGVGYREGCDERYAAKIPEKIGKWPLVIPMLVELPGTDNLSDGL